MTLIDCDIILSHEICILKDTSEDTLPEGAELRCSQAGIIPVGRVSRPRTEGAGRRVTHIRACDREACAGECRSGSLEPWT